MRKAHLGSGLQVVVTLAFALAGCSSSGESKGSETPQTTTGSGGVATSSGAGGAAIGGEGSGGDLGNGGAGLGGQGSGGLSSSASGGATTTQTTGSSSAATLATKLGKPARLLIGLGGSDEAEIKKQGIKPDIFERYLVSLGAGAWPEWNSPSGAYVDQIVGAAADAMGAVPMFTLYQMATAGDGNIGAVISDTSLMTTYWAQTKLLFQRLALYGKPALVNFEPDFWGYVTLENSDPTKVAVRVTINSDCAQLSNDVVGFGKCLVQMARRYAPKACIGFPPSDWGLGTAGVIEFMRKVGASDADFVVMQTLDGDAGCFEAKANTKCQRSGSGWYWDETNTKSPTFHEHFAEAKQYSDGLGKPLVWWQTPLGVAATSAGGTVNHFRDNRVRYFLTHGSELVAAGGLAAVFSPADDQETDITTDNGQFKTLSTAYLASPAALP